MRLISLRHVSHHYQEETSRNVLSEINLEIDDGTFTSVIGRSGSGKSTLLQIIGGLLQPSAGSVAVAGQTLTSLSDNELTDFRRRNIGFVFQSFNLLPTMLVWENVAIPALLEGCSAREGKLRAARVLESVGLSDKSLRLPRQLSGGEMQRVAIARALICEPRIVLADEPTGNLDSATGAMVLSVLRDVASEEGKTLVLVTHDSSVAKEADYVIEVTDGRIAS